jgi:hypothetical protein
MKHFILILIIGLFASCKNDHTCECSIEKTLDFGTHKGKEYSKTVETLKHMTQNRAKSICIDKRITEEAQGYDAVEIHTCKLK